MSPPFRGKDLPAGTIVDSLGAQFAGIIGGHAKDDETKLILGIVFTSTAHPESAVCMSISIEQAEVMLKNLTDALHDLNIIKSAPNN